jgi:hypothetical protein
VVADIRELDFTICNISRIRVRSTLASLAPGCGSLVLSRKEFVLNDVIRNACASRVNHFLSAA